MIVIGILLFALLVVVHELGHFWVARRAGVEVEEFGIGFPPRLLSRRFGKSKTLYSLNLIPLGGFVKLKGESDADRRPHSFGGASFKSKAKILVAGVAMNVAAAFVLILLLAWVGLPRLFPDQFSIKSDEHGRANQVLVVSVSEGSAAAKVGMVQGDRILAIDNQELADAQQLTNYTHSHPGQTVSVSFEHDGQTRSATVQLDRTGDDKGQLGVVPFDDLKLRYTWSAPIVAAVTTLQMLGLTVVGLAKLIAGLVTVGLESSAVANTVGPVGIFVILQNAAELGAVYVGLVVITISVSLAVINILPLPALDGGRLALISLFRLIKKPLNPRLETAVHSVGFVALLALAALISYLDVQRFF